VIQIATPITNREEGAHTGPQKNTGSQKKEPLGVFAKILTGLLRNINKGSAGTGGKTGGEKIPEEVSGEGGEKIPSRNRKKGSPVPAERETAVLFVSPERNLFPAELNFSKIPGGADQIPKAGKKTPQKNAPSAAAGSSLREEFSGETALPPGGTPGAGTPEGESSGVQLKTARAGGAEKNEPPRDRKSAVKEEPRMRADFPGDSPETLPVSWEGIKEPSPVKPEKEENRAAEGRNRDRRRDRMSLDIRDFRTSPPEPAPELKNQVFSRSETGTPDVLAGLSSAGEKGGEGISPGTEGPGESFESLLARELRQDLAGDIVRSAQLVLRDGGEGTIRLSLKPESLGTVKIRLEMAENKITGHIIVENNEALRAFEEEIHSLEQAFLDSGFDGASLDTALASGGGQKQEGWDGGAGERDSFFSRRLAAVTYETAPEWGGTDGTGENSAYGISRQINMLV
jgi:hypothetical protein